MLPVNNRCTALFAAALLACGTTPPRPDAAPDGARTDAGLEAGTDAGLDGAILPDATTDDGPSLTDAAADRALDGGASPDARADGGDGGAGDSGASCASSAYVGDPAWGARLTVEPGAALCAYPAREWSWHGADPLELVRQQALRDALARKSTITVETGDHRLPLATEARAFLLPMCVRDLGLPGPVATAATRVTVTRVEGGIGRPNGIYVESTFGLGAETLAFSIARPLTSATTALLGTAPIAEHQSGVTARRGTTRLYASCALRPTRCANLTIAGLGSVRLDEHRWSASPGLGLGVPIGLRGTLDGVSVDVRSYDAMTGVYSHHAFERTYLFRFASPVRGACALRVDFEIDGTGAAHLTDCDGVPRGAPLSFTATDVACG